MGFLSDHLAAIVAFFVAAGVYYYKSGKHNGQRTDKRDKEISG